MITKEQAKLLGNRLKENPEQIQERLDAIGTLDNLPLPQFKEGLSTTLDSSNIPRTLHNTQYHQSTTHMITHTDNKVIAKLFSEASEHELDLIERYRYSLINPQKDHLIALQQAGSDNGILIIIPPHTKVEEPIRILSQYDTNGFTHILIIAQTGSESMITRGLKEQRTNEATGLICEAVEIIAEDHAKVTYNEAQDLSKSTAWYSQKKARAGPKANIDWYSHVTGASLTKQDTTTLLEGHNAKSVHLSTIRIAKEQHEDSTTNAYLSAANTKVEMHAKATIACRARLLHRGLIDIGDEATGAEGYQQGDALLCGKKAEADIIPQLEIKNPDVACSHGATVGNIEEEELFYLQSRGIDEKHARKIISEAFLASITENADNNQWREEIITIINEGGEQQ